MRIKVAVDRFEHGYRFHQEQGLDIEAMRVRSFRVLFLTYRWLSLLAGRGDLPRPAKQELKKRIFDEPPIETGWCLPA